MKGRWELIVGAVGGLGLLAGSALGLWWAPQERFMLETGRILYVHVPTAWLSMILFTAAFVGSIGWLVKRRWGFDFLSEASVEAGVVLGCLLSVQGSIWAHWTWNTWWAWDPRLTSVAVMVLSFLGILALRSFVDDPEKRATWSATATIVAWVNVPFVYLCVKWMRSLHQGQSSVANIDPDMGKVLLLNTVAVTLVAIYFVVARWRIANAVHQREFTE